MVTDEQLNSDEAKIWKMFLRAHAALMRTMEANLQKAHGISMAWMDALVQLSLAENQRMTHTRLSERALISGKGITRMVDRMAKAGLVVRRASRKDRRVSYIVLTDKGRETLDEISPRQYESVQDLFFRHLHKDDMPVIRDFFARILGED